MSDSDVVVDNLSKSVDLRGRPSAPPDTLEVGDRSGSLERSGSGSVSTTEAAAPGWGATEAGAPGVGV